MRRRWPSSGIAVRRELGRDFCGSNDAPSAAKPAIPLLTLRWTLSAKRACVVSTDTEPDGLAPLAPPAPTPRGLGGGGALLPPARSRGALYVQAQTCAAKDAVCIQDTFAGGRQRDRRPSAN